MDLHASTTKRPFRIHQILASHLIGGAGLIGLHVADHVRSLGHTSTVWVPGRGPATERLKDLQLPWQEYSLAGLRRGGVHQITAAASVVTRLRAMRSDLVHAHNPTIFRYLSPATRLARLKTVVHFHIDPTPDEVRWVLRHPPSAVVTCSRHIQSLIRSYWSAADRTTPVVAVQNAIDLKWFRPGDRHSAKLEVGAPLDRPLLLMMANLAPHKGQLTALRALRSLIDRGIDAEAWFAGEERGGTGTFTAELHGAVAELNLASRVRWLGFRTDGPALMRAADFFLLPSTHEGLPLSVLEAQASGAIVLGAPIPGIAEVVEDGQTGFLIEPPAHDVYADRMAAALTSPALADRIRRDAMSTVRTRHSWSGYLTQVRDLYARLLEPGTRNVHS